MASLKYDYAEMIWDEIRDAAAQDRVVVLPVATYEDHGPHLPVDVDVVLATGICRHAAARIPEEVVLAPPVSHGYSPHHMDFHGTLTITWDTFITALLQHLKQSSIRAHARAGNPEGSDARMVPYWSSVTASGVMGDATKATREKGEQFLEAGVNGLIELVREFRQTPILKRRVQHGAPPDTKWKMT